MAQASHLEKEPEETDPPSLDGLPRLPRGLSYNTGEEGQWSHHGTLQVTGSGSGPEAS